MVAGLVYVGTVMEVDPAGPLINVPIVAPRALFGPVPTCVPNLHVGEKVAVTNLGGSANQFIVLGRMVARPPDIDDIPGLDARLDAIELVDTTQNTRLTTGETKNTQQDGRLTSVENRETSVESRATSLETRTTATETKNTQQDTRLTTNESNIATNTTGLATLRGDTAGRVTTKGDLLIADSSGHLVRKGAPANGLLFVADSASADGWSPRDVLGMPRAPVGATAPTRYLGGITTVGPPVAPLVGTPGDFLFDSNYDLWVCTDAGTPGVWSNRTSNTYGNHTWYGTGGSLARNTTLTVTGGWNASVGNASIATLTNGTLQLNRVGRWFIALQASSDAIAPGEFEAILHCPSNSLWGANVNDLFQGGYTGTGFAGAGLSKNRVDWGGWVSSADIKSGITTIFAWNTATDGPPRASINWSLQANYLGGG